jgi:hypothetical protein
VGRREGGTVGTSVGVMVGDVGTLQYQPAYCRMRTRMHTNLWPRRLIWYVYGGKRGHKDGQGGETAGETCGLPISLSIQISGLHTSQWDIHMIRGTSNLSLVYSMLRTLWVLWWGAGSGSWWGLHTRTSYKDTL